MAQRYIDENDPSLGTYDDGTGDVDPTTGEPTGTGGGTSSGGTSQVAGVGTGDAPGEGNPGPWAIPPADGNWQAWFLKNTQGLPPTPAQLLALKDQLKLHGIDVLTNASGVAGKIKFPDGKVVDVIEAAGLGGKAWQWLDSTDAEGPTDWFDENLGGIEPYEALARPDYLKGEFKLPTWNEEFKPISMSELQNDPGYQNRLAQAQKGFERSAAAKGTILSGGSQIALGREQQNLAANEYGQANSRALDTYLQRYGQFKDRATALGAERGINEGAYQSDVANNLNQYGTRYRTYRDIVDDKKWLADLGLRATAAGAPR